MATKKPPTVQELVDPAFTMPDPVKKDPSPIPDSLPGRTIQITLTRKEEILLGRLQSKAVDQGMRPADTSKSRVIARALGLYAASLDVSAD